MFLNCEDGTRNRNKAMAVLKIKKQRFKNHGKHYWIAIFAIFNEYG